MPDNTEGAYTYIMVTADVVVVKVKAFKGIIDTRGAAHKHSSRSSRSENDRDCCDNPPFGDHRNWDGVGLRESLGLM